MSRNHEARSGFTLTEVLMAMFVMAIGMISLLALFPVAFQSAKWALDNEQVARGAANGQATTELPRVVVDSTTGVLPIVSVNAQSVRNDDSYRPALASNSGMAWRRLAFEAANSPVVATDLANKLGRDTFLVQCQVTKDAMGNIIDTQFRWTFNTNPASVPVGAPAGTKVKFPPVFVDPMVAESFNVLFGTTARISHHAGADAGPSSGTFPNPFRTNNGIANLLPADAVMRPNRSLGMPRLSLSQYINDPDPSRIRMQLENMMGDEIDFGPNGQPNVNAGGQFARQKRFTWAYMCRWPDYKTPEVCDVDLVVFNSRPQLNGLANLPPGEATFTSTNSLIFNKGLTQATIPLGNSVQPINSKAGDWVLDSTLILPGFDSSVPFNLLAVPSNTYTAPFLDTFTTIPVNGLLPGLVGGDFYKILDVSAVQGTSPNFFQTITLDRPAKSDGFSATFLSGVADVITKGVGRMPQH